MAWPATPPTTPAPQPRTQEPLQHQVNQLEAAVKRLETLLMKLTDGTPQPPADPRLHQPRHFEGGGAGSREGADTERTGRERSPRRQGADMATS